MQGIHSHTAPKAVLPIPETEDEAWSDFDIIEVTNFHRGNELKISLQEALKRKLPRNAPPSLPRIQGPLLIKFIDVEDVFNDEEYHDPIRISLSYRKGYERLT